MPQSSLDFVAQFLEYEFIAGLTYNSFQYKPKAMSELWIHWKAS